MRALDKLTMDWVLYWEGGLDNDPDDPGGITNYGITLPVLREMGLAGDLDQDGDIDADDIRNMTLEQARRCYRDVKWNKGPYPKMDDIELEIVSKLFDTAVNQGHYQAAMGLQRAYCSLYGKFTGTQLIAIDGDIGPQTRRVLRALDEQQIQAVLTSMCSEQAGIYRMITMRRPTLKKYLHGWLRRAYSLPFCDPIPVRHNLS